MLLYHFTSLRKLRGIARYGLTVGDVPTDIERHRGRVGVWLTSAESAVGHGLEGSRYNKSECRLTVEVPDGSPLLVKWSDWAPGNVVEDTVKRLHATAKSFESWYIYFGVLPPASIRACMATATDDDIPKWGEISELESDEGVPVWRRNAWHRHLIKHAIKLRSR